MWGSGLSWGGNGTTVGSQGLRKREVRGGRMEWTWLPGKETQATGERTLGEKPSSSVSFGGKGGYRRGEVSKLLAPGCL